MSKQTVFLARACFLCATLLAVTAPLVTATDNVGRKIFHALDKDAEMLAGSVGQGGAVENDDDGDSQPKMFARDVSVEVGSVTPPSDDDNGLLLAIGAIVVLIALGLAFLVGYYVGTVTKNATLSHARAMEMRSETSARATQKSRARANAYPQAQQRAPPKPASPVPQHRHASAAVATASYYTQNKGGGGGGAGSAVSRLDSFRVKTMNNHN